MTFIRNKEIKCVACCNEKVSWVGWIKNLSVEKNTLTSAYHHEGLTCKEEDESKERFGGLSSQGSQNCPERRLQMWCRYLPKSLWGRSWAVEKPTVSLTVFISHKTEGAMRGTVVALPLTSKNKKEEKKRWAQRKWPWHLRLRSAKEGWMLGSARLVSKSKENRFPRFPPENPWARCCEGRHFHWEDTRLTKNQFKPHSCNFWFLKAWLAFFLLHPVPFSQKRKKKKFSNEEKRGKSFKKLYGL